MSIPNWWGDWRQSLTPHTGNLQATDLIECTQIVGGLPVNTVITGQQILNAVPGGGNSPQIIAKKAGTLHVGTPTSGNAMIAYEDISSHIQNYMYLTISMIARKVSGGSSSTPLRLYLNSSASLTGATLLATFSPLTSSTFMIHNIVGACTNNSGYIQAATGTSNYYAATSNTAILIPSPCYLIWASQTPNGDVMSILNSTVTKYV